MVFVSSVVREFGDFRSALEYFLTQQGIRVQVSESVEFLVRGDRQAVKECFANIRDSDFYILLVGATRGSPYEDGISVTRQEYRVAREQFLQTGRPKLLLFVRESTGALMKQPAEAQEQAGIDDSDHLASFVDEIQTAHGPSFLRRFKDFGDLATAITATLNLGRDLMESLARQAVVAELCGNLSKMVSRHGRGVFVNHWRLEKLNRELQISVDNLSGKIHLNKSQNDRLHMGLLQPVKGRDLRTKASEDSLDRGVFLDFNPGVGAFEETSMQVALRGLIDDVESLKSLDDGDWQNEILKFLLAHPGSVDVPQHYVAMAFSYYRRMENVFKSHIAAAQAFITGATDVQPTVRLSPSPYGEREQWRLAAEKVLPSEVRRLLESDIWPFGTRPLASSFGESWEEQVQAMAKELKEMFEDSSRVPEEDDLRRIAESMLGQFASDEEGLGELSPEPQ